MDKLHCFGALENVFDGTINEIKLLQLRLTLLIQEGNYYQSIVTCRLNCFVTSLMDVSLCQLLNVSCVISDGLGL